MQYLLMKRFKQIICGFFLLLAAAAILLIVLSNYLVDDFFKQQSLHENISWKIIKIDRGLFSSTYSTLVKFQNEKDVSVEHEVFFFPKSLKWNSLLEINSFGNLPSSSFYIKNSLIFNKIITNINFDKLGIYADSNLNLLNKSLDFSINVPKFDFFKSQNIDAVAKNSKINGNILLHENKPWINFIDIKIEDIKIETNFAESNLKNFKQKTIFIKESDNLSNASIEISFDSLKNNYNTFYGKEEQNLSKFNADLSFLNINTNSMIKVFETLNSVDDPFSEYQRLMLLGVFIADFKSLLSTSPKIVINDFSGDYNNQPCKINGFLFYTGNTTNANLLNLKSYEKNIHGELYFTVKEKQALDIYQFLINKNSAADTTFDNMLFYINSVLFTPVI